jgi:hypothetical protein
MGDHRREKKVFVSTGKFYGEIEIHSVNQTDKKSCDLILLLTTAHLLMVL